MSIRKYEPSMLDRIDKGIISVHHAYQLVMEEYVWKGTKGKKTFESELSHLFKKYKINDSETAYRKMINTMENLGWSFPKN